MQLLTVTDMYSLELGVFMYKFSTNDLPTAFKEYFHKLCNIHNYETRHINDLNLTNNKKHFRTILFEHVVPYFGTPYLQQLKIPNL